MAVVHEVTAEYQAALREVPEAARSRPEFEAVRWLIEELRVNLFAQVLGTPVPVSPKRIRSALAAARSG